MSNSKVPIMVFEKNQEGKYEYKKIDYVENNKTPDNYSKKSIVYEYNGDILAQIRKKAGIPLRNIPPSDKDDYFVLKPSQQLLEQYLSYLSEKDIPENEAIGQLKKVLEESANDVRPFLVNREGKDFFANISFKEKPKEKGETTDEDKKTVIDLNSINYKEISNHIKEKVIAQDEVVDTLVNNLYNNQKVIESGIKLSANSVILIDGPTGTGKTLILKEIAKEMNLPINIVSSTAYSAAGYEGLNISGMLEGLLKSTNGDLEAAQRGIVVLDEFDKLAGNSETSLEMRKAVQEELLTYFSGTTAQVTYEGKTYDFDTSKISFICVGAFTDLTERKIKESEDGKYTMNPEDYIEEGLMRELVGRFSLFTATKAFNKEDLKRILMDSEISPLKDLEKIAELYGKSISYSDEIVNKIVEDAYEKNTGARALRVVVSSIQNVILPKLLDESEVSTIEITDEILDASKKVVQREGIKR